jgi:hypothetical protein
MFNVLQNKSNNNYEFIYFFTFDAALSAQQKNTTSIIIYLKM